MISSSAARLAWALPVVLLCACSVDVSGDEAALAQRGEVSAAALENGSCVDACGGQAAEGCWCDELCEQYGDCCFDHAQQCADDDTCLFDADCGDSERCLVDLEPESGACCPPNAICIAIMPVCEGTCVPDDPAPCAAMLCEEGYSPVDEDGDGCDEGCAPDESECSSDAECGAGSFCQRPDGQCGGVGSCNVRPSFCYEVFAPVCGCDGVTYGNDCKAASAGVTIDHAGECGLPEGSCEQDTDCGEGQVCQPIQCVTTPCPAGMCQDVEPTSGSCEGSCGDSSVDESCWCDDSCSTWGDCCADYDEQCVEG